ncbi:MAG: NAD(P)-dependent glycerol-3-phosphate dehydrogenase [Proteobacteria bacterium]|nr:NAD(P)-dependent glycerol-3-phosphate dehydrogenase [Pseudomonadota bacterium]
MKRIAVVGAGAWGTTLALVAARAARGPREIVLWAYEPDVADAINARRENPRYLAGVRLEGAIRANTDPAVIAGAEAVLLVTPAQHLRAVSGRLRPHWPAGAPAVICAKGIEQGTSALMTEVVAETLPGVPQAVLSGPTFAAEVARGLPTAVTLASSDPEFARTAARELHGAALRVYSSDDVIGVEVAGAVKNVMAIAAGICDGLALGLNARAALITRGLAEMTRLGVRLGGRIETFMGLAGAGDLILTCTGDLSRNRRVGLKLAQGVTLTSILAELGHVAEGVYSAREVARLGWELAVDMPITRAVCRVLDDPAAAGTAVQELLQREPKAEY